MAETQKMILAPWVNLEFETPNDQSCFFGYYYHSPVSSNGLYLLAHRAKFDGRDITALDEVEIGYFDLRDGAWNCIGISKAFNWQQGAMLQWIGPDFNTRIIFNDQEEDRFISRIFTIKSGNRRKLKYPIYDLHPSGEYALGVYFERHFYTRAYHYEGIRNDFFDLPIHPDDGILKIDLNSGNASVIIKTSDIAVFGSENINCDVNHWLEHLTWNPSGSRFYFLHRYGGNDSYVTRVFTANPDGENLYSLPDDYGVSYTHMGWRDDNTFVNYFTKTKPLGQSYSLFVDKKKPLIDLLLKMIRIIKRLFPNDFVDRQRAISGYQLVCDQGKLGDLISTGLLRLDGHPSWTRDRRFMLTDTYADKDGYRHLLIFDSYKNQVHVVGKFFSPYNNSSYRCDLHPRLSFDDKRIIIDTAHSGKRQILILSVEWDYLLNI